MSGKIKTSAGWKNLAALKLKNSAGIWKNIAKGYLKTSSGWKIFFSSNTVPMIDTKVIISQSTSSADGLITLTGTNYHWSDSTAGILSLQYWFERSDGTLIGTKHTATNPSSGSSLQYTQIVPSSSMLKNTDTLLRFVVECINTTTSQLNTSVSDTTTFNGPRDISNLTAGTASYLSIPLTFTPGAYDTSYRVAYTYSGGYGSLDSYGSGVSDKTITVTGLQANTSYTFTITPYSGSIVGGSVTGYPGNTSSSVTKSTLTAISPTQTTAPTKPGGTGEYSSTVTTGTTGVYTAGTYTSKTTKLVSIVSSNPAPTNGSISEAGVVLTSPYTVTQGAFTSPYSNFYTRDDVLGVDGVTTYYYYSSSLSAYASSIIDNFNRADNNMSSPNNVASNGMQYNATYSTYSNAWFTLSNKAWSSQSISSNASTNPKMVIESGGKVNITGSIQYPETTSAGYGLAFWTTSSGSWWSVSPNCLTSTSTVCGTTYTTGLTSCPATGSNVGDYCGSCVSYTDTISTCTGSSTGSFCPVGSCDCTYHGATSPTCSVAVNGAGVCPPTGTQPGDRCSDCSSPTCNGGTADYADNTLGTACGDKCSCTGPYSKDVYGCGSLVSHTGCPLDYTTTYSAATVGIRCSSCIFLAGNTYLYSVVEKTGTSTYYTCTKSTCNYTAYNNGAAAYYSYGTAGTANVTRYKSYKNISQTNYDTYLQIYSSNGSIVTSKASQKINTDTSGYVDLYLVGVTTNNGVITAKAYSSLTIQEGTDLTYTRQSSDPAMSSSNGTSAHGMIKMYTLANEAGYIDNLSITLNS